MERYDCSENSILGFCLIQIRRNVQSRVEETDRQKKELTKWGLNFEGFNHMGTEHEESKFQFDRQFGFWLAAQSFEVSEVRLREKGYIFFFFFLFLR